MTYDEILRAADDYLTAQERIRLAFALSREYDGRTFEALGEAWAEDNLNMRKAERGAAGIDGMLPNGRTLQIKSKKANAHADNATYVTLSAATLAKADCLLIVFVNYDTCEVVRWVGPVAIGLLTSRNNRYYISDILDLLEKVGGAC